MTYTGIREPHELRTITRANDIAYRDEPTRRKLAALSSLDEYLCDRNTVPHNPVRGVTRPKVETYEGKTPAI